jgi:hypothetical protein
VVVLTLVVAVLALLMGGVIWYVVLLKTVQCQLELRVSRLEKRRRESWEPFEPTGGEHS